MEQSTLIRLEFLKSSHAATMVSSLVMNMVTCDKSASSIGQAAQCISLFVLKQLLVFPTANDRSPHARFTNGGALGFHHNRILTRPGKKSSQTKLLVRCCPSCSATRPRPALSNLSRDHDSAPITNSEIYINVCQCPSKHGRLEKRKVYIVSG
jgi:hypothetical protein